MNQRAFPALRGLFVTGLAVALLAACSSHRDAPDQAGASPGSASPGATAPGDQSLGSAAPSGPGQGAAPQGGSPCTANDFALAQLPGGDAASGTVIVAIGLTSKSGRACVLNGYPDFTLSGGGHTLPVTIQHGGLPVPPINAAPQPVIVNSGARAGFQLVYQNRPTSGTGSCSAATQMTLKLGGATVTGPVQVSVCGPAVKVSPYVPGSKLVA